MSERSELNAPDPLLGGAVGAAVDHPALRRLAELEERVYAHETVAAPARPASVPESGRESSRKPGAIPPRSRKDAGPAPSLRRMPAMGYQPALDALRAVSVVAVIFYHAGFDWMRGGFIGVEVFFVVSGFLITSLLIDERERSASTSGVPVKLGQFWLRRARRLLPALFTVLAAVAVWTVIAGTDEQQAQLRRDLPWAIFYVGNWGQILGDVPYYAGDPPLLRHLWSLAVEEQWYLIWPLVFIVLSRTSLGRAATARVLFGAAAAAMFFMALLHHAGPGPIGGPIGLFEGVDRVNFMYLSTFTRCSGLLLGAAAAFVWRPWRSPIATASTTTRRAGFVLDVAGAGAVGGLVAIASVAVITEGYLYQWLMALVSVLSLVAVVVAVHPAAIGFRTMFSWKPLVELGKRSYGLYLWHFPIFVFADATEPSAARFAGALAVTFVLSELCYRFVETPVRRGALGRWFATAGTRRLVPLAGSAALVAALAGFYANVEEFDRAAGGTGEQFVLVTEPAGSLAADADGDGPGGVAIEPALLEDEARRLVVVGDSQAHALAINLPDGIEDAFDVTDGSVEGCSVYDGGRVFSERQGFNNSFAMCEGWAEDWADAAEEADAEVALVVLGAWDVFDLETSDGERLSFGTSDWDDYVTDGLQEGIDALAAEGVEVALLEVACMRPQDVSGAGVPALPERGDDDRVEHLNELWQDVAAANPDVVTFVEGPDEWCDDEDVATDLGYRWDGVHVYQPGANLIYTTIAPTLLEL